MRGLSERVSERVVRLLTCEDSLMVRLKVVLSEVRSASGALDSRWVLPDEPLLSESPPPEPRLPSPSPSSRSLGVTTSRCEAELACAVCSACSSLAGGDGFGVFVVVEEGEDVDVVASDCPTGELVA